MVDSEDKKLSIVQKCALVGISRSSFYFQGKGESPLNLKLMRLMDEQFLQRPFYGSRQMGRWLRRTGYCVSRKRVKRLMRKMGLVPVYQAPRTSLKHPGHRIHPYLLRGITVDRPNQAWCVDITYIPMQRGFLYLVTIMDWHSRKVLAWRLSNTMEASFCVEALEDAVARYGVPEIINSDQGSQFTGLEWTQAVQGLGAKISMDGVGRWLDNVFVERLWRSLKYECVYLNAFETGSEARTGIGDWMVFYNMQRPHSSLAGRTPHEAYNGLPMQVTNTAAA